MALFEIKEPVQAQSKKSMGRGIGIDLGTTHSLVATFDETTQTIGVCEAEGHSLMPSLVYYPEQGSPLVGQDAIPYARSHVEHTISSVKRFMGLGRHEALEHLDKLPYDLSPSTDAMIKIVTPHGVKTPPEVSAEILKSLMKRVRGPVAGAVIGVPAYFDDAQRQATMDAARIANIHVLRLINEPTAAALAYHLDEAEEGQFLVYDLGGGTFDVTLLSMQKGVFEVLATGGDTQLGGDDIDALLVDYIQSQMGETIESPIAYKHLLLDAKVAKEALSSTDEVTIGWRRSDFSTWTQILSRSTFEGLIEELVDRTIRMTSEVLRSAGVSKSSLKNVIFVGGATHIPYVRERVTQALACEGLCSISPETVVAIGAAHLAEKLAGNSHADTLVLDVTPLSLGLEMMGGVNEKIIPRNTTLPASVTQSFTTYQDNQTGLSLHIVQGERELASDCRSLGKAVLSGIPPMLAGKAKIEVTFDVDIDGILTVTARETTTGSHTHMTVKPSYGLSEDEISSMLMQSIDNAEDDVRARRLALLCVEARQLLTVVKKALEEDAHLIDEPSQDVIIESVITLKDLLYTPSVDDLADIKKTVQHLEQSVEELFAKRLQAGLNHALKGQSVQQFEALES